MKGPQVESRNSVLCLKLEFVLSWRRGGGEGRRCGRGQKFRSTRWKGYLHSLRGGTQKLELKYETKCPIFARDQACRRARRKAKSID